MNLYDIPVKFRLILAFSTSIIVTVVISIFSILEIKKGGEITKNIFEHPYIVSNSIKQFQIDFLKIYNLELHLTADSKTQNIKDIAIEVERLHHNILKNLEIITEHYLGPKNDVKTLYDFYLKTYGYRKNLVDFIKSNNQINIIDHTKEGSIIEPTNFDNQILKLKIFADNKAKEFFSKVQVQEEKVIKYLIITLIFFIIMSLIIAMTITKSIIKPLTNLVNITNRIHEGDLTIINLQATKDLAKRGDEIGLLCNSYYNLLNYLLLPYRDIIKNNTPLADKTGELRRLLQSFDKFVIASKTDVSGFITYVSKAFLDISGYRYDELVGKSHSIIKHPDTPKEFTSAIWSRIQSHSLWSGEIKNIRKDGTFYWIKTNISPDIDTHGNIVGYNSISEDITAKKAYEDLLLTLEYRISEEIQKNQDKTAHMLQQSRLAQMGEMISMIAHQWRQPLASISAISGSLTIDVMMQNYNEEYFKENLESISDLSQHLSSTIDDFRDFFKIKKETEDVLPRDIVKMSLAIIETTLKNKGIYIHTQYDDTTMLKSYANELKQVILNIIKNAEDILLDKNIQDPKIWVKCYEDKLNAYISIEDNAGGVLDSVVDKIFDPYFSTKEEKDGTGLGLYMSKTIIEEHCGGKLLLKNQNKGALFTISLPLNERV